MRRKSARYASSSDSSSSSGSSERSYVKRMRENEKKVPKYQKAPSQRSASIKSETSYFGKKKAPRPVPEEVGGGEKITPQPFQTAFVSSVLNSGASMRAEEELRRRLMTKQNYLDLHGPPMNRIQGEFYRSLPSASLPQAQVVHLQPTAYATSTPASVIDLVSESSGQPGYSALDMKSTHSSDFLVGKKRRRAKSVSSTNSSLSNKSRRRR